MNPKISIIVPVYNVEKYLRACLDSVCNQTYKNLEIICVDDGSTDGSSAILQEYAEKDNRIIVIYQENAGLSAARNAGLNAVTGDWITGVDSDDYLEPDAYEYCIQHLRKYENEDIPMVIFGYGVEYAETGKPVWLEPLPDEGLVMPTLNNLTKMGAYFWNKLWRADVLRSFDASFPVGMYYEDIAFFYRIAPYLKQILYLPQIKYHYLKHKAALAITDRAKRDITVNMDRFRSAELVFKKYRDCPVPKSLSHLADKILEAQYRIILHQFSNQAVDIAYQAFKRLADKYVAPDYLYSNYRFAQYYHFPPSAIKALDRIYGDDSHYKGQVSALRKDMLLLANERRLYWQYRCVQLLGHLTWGKKCRKYKEKKRHYHELLRRCRKLRKNLI